LLIQTFKFSKNFILDSITATDIVVLSSNPVTYKQVWSTLQLCLPEKTKINGKAVENFNNFANELCLKFFQTQMFVRPPWTWTGDVKYF